MRNAPSKPVFKLKLEKDSFKALFQSYFSSFKRIYNKTSIEARIGGQTARNTKKTEKKLEKHAVLLKKSKVFGEVIEENEENYE